MAAARPAISRYSIDVLSVGALSLLVMVPMLAFRDRLTFLQDPELANALTLGINFPHFMASYALVYRSRDLVLRYKRSTLLVPGVLLAWIVFGLVMAQTDGIWFHLLYVVGGLYIGIHYVGQTWGMMAAYSHLEGQRFEDHERRWIWAGLSLLAFWHASFFARGAAQAPPGLQPVLDVVHLLAGWGVVFAIGLTGYGMLRYARRLGHLPAVRVWMPWLSIFVWYAVFAGFTAGAFWVQIAHSLQYLIFPGRMELNRRDRARGEGGERGDRLPAGLHIALWYGALFLGGYVVFRLLPDFINAQLVHVPRAHEAVRLMPMAVTLFVNIHHYYTDGEVWKLRDPEVRRDLFRHLKR